MKQILIEELEPWFYRAKKIKEDACDLPDCADIIAIAYCDHNPDYFYVLDGAGNKHYGVIEDYIIRDRSNHLDIRVIKKKDFDSHYKVEE